jgi:hypothetical protein
MWHSAQRAEISEEICMFHPGRCQARGTWLISTETNNEELLIARQRFHNHGYIDGNNWLRSYIRKATDSFKRVHDKSPRYTRATPGNQLECSIKSFTHKSARTKATWCRNTVQSQKMFFLWFLDGSLYWHHSRLMGKRFCDTCTVTQVRPEDDR